MFDAVLVANRGEIAVRIGRTLRALGIRHVAVYTDPDRGARHVVEADEAVPIGPAPAYLDVARIVDAAVRSGVDAVHPGYGFLAENPELARRLQEAGRVFIGPPVDAIVMMGDKINAKRAVAAAGVPVVPGRNEPGLDDAQLGDAAREIGLPVLLKPSAGGGGKGMRQVTDWSELQPAIEAARREAASAFGDSTLLVERLVARPRHIEIQVFADTHGTVVSLGERECSLQRRHQKIVEEAPSPLLDDATRAAMGASAVATARACGYVGAGTVEFIVSADEPDRYYFMEMNTRLQVEHPVTEMVLGVDLVEWQLRVASGERLPWDESHPSPAPRGHAIEARVYAEDPARGFLPASGPVLALREPTAGPHVRVDSGLWEGSVVGTDYDPMLAKVVAWGAHRADALRRIHRALAQTAVLGVTTNVGFLRRLLAHPDVTAGRLDTELVERILPDLLPDPGPDDVVAAAALLTGESPPGSGDPWAARDGWRVGGAVGHTSRWRFADREVQAVVADGTVTVGDAPSRQARVVSKSGGVLTVESEGDLTTYSWASDHDTVWIGRDGDSWTATRLRETVDRAGPAASGDGPVTSPMPGVVLVVNVNPGDGVHAGQPLMAVEAMKMEHVIVAPIDGTVEAVLVKPGQHVVLDQPLAVVAHSVEEDS